MRGREPREKSLCERGDARETTSRGLRVRAASRIRSGESGHAFSREIKVSRILTAEPYPKTLIPKFG